jgi:site-specific recombinase XerD
VSDLVPSSGREVGPPDDLVALLARLRQAWLDEVCDSAATTKAYEHGHDEWIAHLDKIGIGPEDILGVKRHDIAAYRRTLEAKSLSPSTVAQKLAIISSFYGYCEEVDVIVRNPAASARRPKLDPDSSNTRGLTQDEARRLIRAAELRVKEAKVARVQIAATRDAAIVAVMLCTGGRISEVTSALIEDLGYDRGHRVLFLNRKGGKRQAVALGESAYIIDRHIANENRETGLIFRTRTGKSVDRSHIFRVIRKVATDAHLPGANRLTPHSLRHTFATLAFDAGADISQVQDAMGHADPRTTRRYDRARNRIDKSPVHAISKALLEETQ